MRDDLIVGFGIFLFDNFQTLVFHKLVAFKKIDSINNMIQKINSFWITFLNIYLYLTLQIIYTFLLIN